MSEANDDCDASGPCPTNSPVIASFLFHELSIDTAQPNAEGFVIGKFVIDGSEHELSVKDGHIRGRRGDGIVTGGELGDAQLWLRRGSTEYVLRIASVINVRMWAQRDAAEPVPEIEAYVVEWSGVVGGQPTERWRNVWAAAARTIGTTEEMFGPRRDATFVFEGERIDPRAKVITGWIAAGSTSAAPGTCCRRCT